MVRTVVICTFICGVVGTIQAQQVEIPREKTGKAAPVKHSAAQSSVESPQTVAYMETSSPTMPKLTIEQMRQAGALAARRVQEEIHDIEPEASEPAPAPRSPKKQISANAVR